MEVRVKGVLLYMVDFVHLTLSLEYAQNDAFPFLRRTLIEL